MRFEGRRRVLSSTRVRARIIVWVRVVVDGGPQIFQIAPSAALVAALFHETAALLAVDLGGAALDCLL